MNRLNKRFGLFAIIAVLSVAGAWGIRQRARQAALRGHIERGKQLLRQGQNGAAQQQWREATRLAPGDSEAWELLGDFYVCAGDCATARPALERAIAIEPRAAVALRQLAGCDYETKNYQSAQRHAQSALQQRPDDAQTLQLMVQIAGKLGDRAARLRYLEKWVELRPKDGAALADLVGELQFRKEYDRAIPFADRLVAARPDAASAYFTRGSTLFAAASDDEMLKLARADFEKALQLEPGDIEARRFLARTHVLLGQPRLAIEQFEQIGRGRPYVSAHLFELAGAYRRAGDIKRADEILKRFTSVREFNVNALELGNSVKRQPQSAGPVLKLGNWFLTGLREDADDTLFQLYRFRFLRGEWQPVDFYLQRASELSPDDIEVRNALRELDNLNARYLEKSRIALQRGDDNAAKSALAHALLLRPDADPTRALARKFEERGLDALGALPLAARAQKPAD